MNSTSQYLLYDGPNDALSARWSGQGPHVSVVLPASPLDVPRIHHAHRLLGLVLVCNLLDVPLQLRMQIIKSKMR